MRFLTLSVFATLLSAPAFAADLGTYRPGTPYSSSVAAGADVCDNQCAGDAQCRGWNYVKPNLRAAGICEFLSSVSTPISSQISISGVRESDSPYYERLTTGDTNTVRVGTQVLPQDNTVRVGQAPAGRQIVRRAQPPKFKAQPASTRPVVDMSLTAQQNRYRQAEGHLAAPQYVPGQRPAFRPILETSLPQYRGQQIGQPQINPYQAQQPQTQSIQMPAPRRATGPRRVQEQGYAAPQFQNPQYQGPQFQDQQFQGQPVQGQGQATPQFQDPQFQDPRAQQNRQQFQPQQAQLRGQSRPPIGQPIVAPQAPVRSKLQSPSERLAQLTAQTPVQSAGASQLGPVSLNPEQARASLFGRLNDDVNIPTAISVPTKPVAEQSLGEILAGGY